MSTIKVVGLKPTLHGTLEVETLTKMAPQVRKRIRQLLDRQNSQKLLKVKIEIPNKQSGPWKTETLTATKEHERIGLLRAMFSESGRYVPAGTYKRLTRDNDVIMSSTPDEVRDHLFFVSKAHGDVLINGLGLGLALKMILDKKEHGPVVKTVTVIEKSEDVIKLVAPTYLKDKRVTIIQADAFTYKPKQRFNVVWHDIWDAISVANLPEMHRLHRKYGSKCDWQGSWCRKWCEKSRLTNLRERKEREKQIHQKQIRLRSR